MAMIIGAILLTRAVSKDIFLTWIAQNELNVSHSIWFLLPELPFSLKSYLCKNAAFIDIVLLGVYVTQNFFSSLFNRFNRNKTEP